MPGPSRVGTLTDPLKGRVVTDEYLNKVDAGSAEATFVYKPADYQRVKARREELGLGTDEQAGEAARVQRESRKVELASRERRIATLEAELESLRAASTDDEKAEKAAVKK